MKKIKEYRMSLMEKDSVGPSKEEGKCNYIIRSTAILEIDKLVKDQNISEEEYDEFVLNSSEAIFSELLKKSKTTGDSVGLWITFEDKFEIDNSMDLSVLEDLKVYGDGTVNPIKEFFKMTVQE